MNATQQRKTRMFIIASMIGLAVWIVWTTHTEREHGSPTSDTNTSNSNEVPIRPNKDSDGDGIPDWEEGLYGLDPHSKDSDGDGIPDSEEVKERQESFVTRGAEDVDTQKEESVFEKLERLSEGVRRPESEEESDVFIHRISPATVSRGDTITIYGEGFTKTGNKIYAGYDVLYNQPSPDGETISFTFNPDFSDVSKSATNTPEFPLWMYVENENGLSNVGTLRMRVQ